MKITKRAAHKRKNLAADDEEKTRKVMWKSRKKSKYICNDKLTSDYENHYIYRVNNTTLKSCETAMKR